MLHKVAHASPFALRAQERIASLCDPQNIQRLAAIPRTILDYGWTHAHLFTKFTVTGMAAAGVAWLMNRQDLSVCIFAISLPCILVAGHVPER